MPAHVLSVVIARARTFDVSMDLVCFSCIVVDLWAGGCVGSRPVSGVKMEHVRNDVLLEARRLSSFLLENFWACKDEPARSS